MPARRRRRGSTATVLNRPVPDPFLAGTSWHVPRPLELPPAAPPGATPHRRARLHLVLPQAAAAGLGRARSLVRRVVDARWHDLGDGVLRFDVEASAFCHQMVRSIVGTLVAMGEGRLRPGEMLGIIAAATSASGCPSSPAPGASASGSPLSPSCRRAARAVSWTVACRGPRRPAGTPRNPPPHPKVPLCPYTPRPRDPALAGRRRRRGPGPRSPGHRGRPASGASTSPPSPHIDTGDHVIIVNADRVVLTSGKAERKLVHRHSGYPGGLKTRPTPTSWTRSPRRPCAAPSRACCRRTASAARCSASSRSTPAQPPHAAQHPGPVLEHARAATDDRERSTPMPKPPDHRPPQVRHRPRPRA